MVKALASLNEAWLRYAVFDSGALMQAENSTSDAILAEMIVRDYGAQLEFSAIGIDASDRLSGTDAIVYAIFKTHEKGAAEIPLTRDGLSKLSTAAADLPEDFPNREAILQNMSSQIAAALHNLLVNEKVLLELRQAEYKPAYDRIAEDLAPKLSMPA